ncbi:hypothetical protein LZ31DRAFT_557797 [Colletotrichum somersetense]|nr:hypothetical protein LZ31DRAFT_557797 [Colletotrichum somersetense]
MHLPSALLPLRPLQYLIIPDACSAQPYLDLSCLFFFALDQICQSRIVSFISSLIDHLYINSFLNPPSLTASSSLTGWFGAALGRQIVDMTRTQPSIE